MEREKGFIWEEGLQQKLFAVMEIIISASFCELLPVVLEYIHKS